MKPANLLGASVVVGAFNWPPLGLIPRAPIIGFIHAVELSGITLTLASVPVIAVDANVMPEPECKMLPGTLCRARPAAILAYW